MPDTTIDDDTAQETLDEVEDAGEDVKWYQRLGATAFLIVLYASIAGAIVAGIYFDYITPDILITVVINAGWVGELVIAGLGISFILFVFGMVLAALPASLTGALGSLGYAAAKSQGFITDDE